MCNNRPIVNSKWLNPLSCPDDYSTGQVSNIIKHYQELKSVVELVSSRWEAAGGGGCGGKEEILCTLIDIDQAINGLSFKQKQILSMVKQGYSFQEVSLILNTTIFAVKFLARKGVIHLTAYLNSH